jgi:muconolactone delta-isomerase
MHPVITEAIAAQRARELHAHAAAARRAHQLRRSGQVGRVWRFLGFPRGGRVPARPLRGPRAA